MTFAGVPEYMMVWAIRAEAKYVPEEIPVVVTGSGKTAAAVAVAKAPAARDTAWSTPAGSSAYR